MTAKLRTGNFIMITIIGKSWLNKRVNFKEGSII